MLIIKLCIHILSSRLSKVTLVQTTDMYPTFRFFGEDVENYSFVSEHQGQRAIVVCELVHFVLLFRCLHCLPNHWGYKEVKVSLVWCIAITSAVLTNN